MLAYLRVRHFRLADAVEVEFDPGFTALTGETGAGKSLIIDALGLLLGERASVDSIADGADRADIQAGIALPAEHPAHAWLAERELASDGECLLRRTLSRSSASRAYINGTAVAAAELRELGELLVDVHGQHEHQRLASRDRQRETLDAYAGLTAEVEAMAQAFRRWRDAAERLEKRRNRGEAERERARLLGFQVAELEALALVPGEEETLQADHHRLAHAQDLLAGVSEVLQVLDEADQDSIGERLGRAGHTIAALVRHDDSLASAAGTLDTLAIEVAELAADLRHRLSAYEFDPERFDALQKRLDQLHGASRKYQVAMAELPQLLERLRAERDELADDDAAIAEVEAEVAALEADYRETAADIAAKRKRAGARIGKAVAAQLADLGMAGATFQVRLAPRETPRASGTESVEFLIAANPGQSPGPLSKVASGGELSRVALAINMVCNHEAAALTQIYDEVDVGIGGRVAEMVGQKLRALAAKRQVLCVTHLPQVASQAQHQLRVRKAGERAKVSVEALDDDARQDEIARMLGGIEITDRTLEHAGEMLRKARQ